MNTIQKILNELKCKDALEGRLLKAKIAAGGRRTHVDMYGTETWIGIPDTFPATACEIIIDECQKWGVAPESIGRYPGKYATA